MAHEHSTTTIDDLHATIARLRWNDELDMYNNAGLREAIRQLPEGRYTVVFCDIDKMKAINSATRSHCQTNRYLRAGLARRHGEIAGQLYGDEFVYILDEAQRRDDDSPEAFVAYISRQLAGQPLTISERYHLAAAQGCHVSQARLSATFAVRSGVAADAIFDAIEQCSSEVLLMKARRDDRAH